MSDIEDQEATIQVTRHKGRARSNLDRGIMATLTATIEQRTSRGVSNHINLKNQIFHSVNRTIDYENKGRKKIVLKAAPSL